MQIIQQILALAALLLAVVACRKVDTPVPYPTVGDKIPGFNVTGENGVTVTDADLTSGESLLVFFHTACPDCRKELEILRPFYDKYHDTVHIVLISREEDDTSVSRYWNEYGYSLPYVTRTNRYPYELFSDRGIPYVVYSVNGVVRGIWNDTVLFSEEEFLKLHLL